MTMLTKTMIFKLSIGTREIWKVSYLELLELMYQGREKLPKLNWRDMLLRHMTKKEFTEIKAIWKDYFLEQQELISQDKKKLHKLS